MRCRADVKELLCPRNTRRALPEKEISDIWTQARPLAVASKFSLRAQGLDRKETQGTRLRQAYDIMNVSRTQNLRKVRYVAVLVDLIDKSPSVSILYTLT
jgi:hypothetical protein